MDYIWTSLSAVQKAVKHNHSLTHSSDLASFPSCEIDPNCLLMSCDVYNLRLDEWIIGYAMTWFLCRELPNSIGEIFRLTNCIRHEFFRCLPDFRYFACGKSGKSVRKTAFCWWISCISMPFIQFQVILVLPTLMSVVFLSVVKPLVSTQTTCIYRFEANIKMA